MNMKVVNDLLGYKNFKIVQNDEWFVFSLDSVLLPNFVRLNKKDKAILDIGTGTGLISLMMAQRCNARIRAVDIDADAVEQARGNVAASPWQDRIEVELQDICHFTSETLFDVIVSNPPYFTISRNNHRKNAFGMKQTGCRSC